MKISDMTTKDLEERLILEVINYEESADRIFNFPFIRKGSFAILPQLCMGDKNLTGHYTTCLNVTNDMLNGWNIDKTEVFQLAAKNSAKEFPISVEPITEFLNSDEVRVFLEDSFDISQVYVLSNETYFNGAAAMFYPDSLDQTAQSFDTEKLFILPISVNYVYCMPIDNGISEKELVALSKEVSKVLEKENRLCDNLMVYDAANKKVEEYGGDAYSVTFDAENNLKNKKMNGGR